MDFGHDLLAAPGRSGPGAGSMRHQERPFWEWVMVLIPLMFYMFWSWCYGILPIYPQ